MEIRCCMPFDSPNRKCWTIKPLFEVFESSLSVVRWAAPSSSEGPRSPRRPGLRQRRLGFSSEVVGYTVDFADLAAWVGVVR